MKITAPPPASVDAIAAGCTCDPVLNNGGHGATHPQHGPFFWCECDCPLHGHEENISDSAAQPGNEPEVGQF
jgi:hypothetical protein